MAGAVIGAHREIIVRAVLSIGLLATLMMMVVMMMRMM
jgi:hypothetical protein